MYLYTVPYSKEYVTLFKAPGSFPGFLIGTNGRPRKQTRVEFVILRVLGELIKRYPIQWLKLTQKGSPVTPAPPPPRPLQYYFGCIPPSHLSTL